MGASAIWAHCSPPIDATAAHLESPAWCPSAGSTSLEECACCPEGRAWAPQPFFRGEALQTADSSKRRSEAKFSKSGRFPDRKLS